MQPAGHNTSSVIRYLCIGTILASACFGEAPEDLARIVARKESASAAARLQYTYRQKVFIQEFDNRNLPAGHYEEVRDVIFSPEAGRSERFLKGPISRLRRLVLTAEDFRDIREVQPFLFTEDRLWAYETRYRGEEMIDGEPYYLLDVRPRQVFQGQRLFEGLLWIHKQDLAVARSQGIAVPPIFTSGSENLFPSFTTIRAQIDGEHWFPVHTQADDVLPFRNGPIHMRMTIDYSDYRRFGAESTIRYDAPR